MSARNSPGTLGSTALILALPALDRSLGGLRRLYDPAAGLGVVAHVTVLIPFVNVAELTGRDDALLSELCGATTAMDISFSTVGRFVGTVWLAPASARCHDLISSVQSAWPLCVPYDQADRAVVPHLSVANGVDERTCELVAEALAGMLPLDATAEALTLLVWDGSRWDAAKHYPLGHDLAQP
jgi:hypothetical protein